MVSATLYFISNHIKGVILNAVKNLSVSTYFQPRIDLEILRYAQDDSVVAPKVKDFY